MCHVCGIAQESLEDQESASFWIVCAGRTCRCKSTASCKHECNWWVHNRRVNITMKTLTPQEKPGQRSTSAKNMPDVRKVG